MTKPNSRSLLLLMMITVILIPCTAQSMQVNMSVGTSIYIDQGSGSIMASSHTYVYPNFAGTYVYAEVRADLLGDSKFSSGSGSAEVEVYGQVTVLGNTYQANGTHYGYEYVGDDIGMIDKMELSEGWSNVPVPPVITLAGIDASNPSGNAHVIYNISDPVLYDLRMSVNGSTFYTADPINTTVSFGLDQNNLPSGGSIIATYGNMYGVTVPGPSFGATVSYTPATSSKSGIILLPILNEDYSPVVVSFSSDIIESTTKVNYGAGPISGSYLTRSDRSSVNLNTAGNNSSVPSTIVSWPVDHTFHSLGYWTSMNRVSGPTLPPQSGTFWTLEAPGGGWLQVGTSTEACNSVGTVMVSTQLEVVPGSPTGCLSTIIP